MSLDPGITTLEREYCRKALRLVRFRGAAWFLLTLAVSVALLFDVLVWVVADIRIAWLRGEQRLLVTAAAMVPCWLMLRAGWRSTGRLVRAVEGNGYRNCPRCGRGLEGSGDTIGCGPCRESYRPADIERAWRATLARFRKGQHYV